MRVRNYRYYSCDFETTVYEGQKDTEVWAATWVELYSENVTIVHSIDAMYDYFKNQKQHCILYFHNLKFDGNFWLSYLIGTLKLQQAFEPTCEEGTEGYFLEEKHMKNNTFKYAISDMGQWYSITIKVNNHFIEIRDSLKLLPFSVKRIGESFNTKHKKLEMEYTGRRFAGCKITPEEKAYIANDVLVVKEALEIMYTEGHTGLTIGSCCLGEFKKLTGKEEYDVMFPDLTKIEIDADVYGAPNADKYIRRSYRGGWCYLVKGKENKVKHNGTTADVNSLYPSMMSSESGNAYPVGKPHFWKGNFIPDEAKRKNAYYFIRIKTRFYVRKNKLPFVQIKGNYLYKGTEMLESSDVYDEKTGEYYSEYYNHKNELKQAIVTLTLTMTDYELIKEHYELVDFEILDGCYFISAVGIFDTYIEKYKRIKLESKGALRELAKLFLNNLYGKLAASTDSSFKLAYLKEDGSIGFLSIPANDKKAGFIACGSAVTSYARNFTIRAAQKNYYGKDKAGFIYADTDSIHCDLLPEEIKGINAHDKNFCCWKLESCWDEAIFVRQKTYIEHVTHEDLQQIEKPYYNVKCAGMSQRCKDLFVKSMEGVTEEEKENFTTEAWDFVKEKRYITDFKLGLKITGKLMPKRIKGGVLLIDTTYEMR